MKRAHTIPMTSGDEYDALTNGGAVAPEPEQTEQEKLEFQIGFYGLANVARRDEISAIEAADLIAIGAHDVANLDGKAKKVPWENNDKNRKHILLLILERGESKQTMQPLSVWLSRSRAKKIRYMTALDEAVLREPRAHFREFDTLQHGELVSATPPESLNDQALESALKAMDSVPEITENQKRRKLRNTPGPKQKVVDAQRKVRLAATKFFAFNENAWNATQYPAWEILNMVEVIREVWGVEAKQLPWNDAKDKDKFKVERKVNLREMCNAVNYVRPCKPVEN